MSLPEIAGHELKDLIGSGACGAVYRAVSSDNKACAVKVFSSMAINRKALARALNALQQMPHHRGILPVESFNFDQSPYFAAMPLIGVMTKDNHGNRVWQTPTLESACNGLPPEQAWRYVYELADAVAWLHKHGIPHGNLRPSNILLEDDPESSVRVTDLAQGWVGGIHHLELADHFVHICPEQAENPDGVFAGYGHSWDVYSFGVLAYRLLTGQLPRAAEAWESEVAKAYQQSNAGLAYQLDNNALLQAVRAQPKISWPEPAASKWEERRRSIIERALDLNPSARWTDLREVVREFEVLESDYLLEESREQTVQERKKQASKVRTLQIIGLSLLSTLTVCTVYAFITLRRAQKAEITITDNAAQYQVEIDEREGRIASLTDQRDDAILAKKTSDANLQHSQTAVDQFLTQLLQTPTGNQMEVDFSSGQLFDALAFLMRNLTGLEANPQLGVERLRTYGNIGQIHLKLRELDLALSFLEKARKQAADLLASDSNSSRVPLYHQWLGRYSLLVSDIRGKRGEVEESLKLLREATTHLQEGLAADPHNRLARNECARAWLEYGLRTLRNGEVDEASLALKKVGEVLDPQIIESELTKDEQFLLARSKYARGLAQRDAGKIEDAITTLIDSVQAMGELVLGSSPRNQEQALLLAEAYTELAELIGKHFSADDAMEAHSQAVPILLELNRLLPEWPEVKFLLARNYGAMSLLARDTGKTSDATKKTQDAIELMNEIVSNDPENDRYAFVLARLRGEYAELMADLGKPTTAVPIVQQAVESLESLLAKRQGAKLTPERLNWEIQLAQMYGVLGHTSQSAKNSDLAKSSFASATAKWEQLAAAVPEDEVVKQGLLWSKDRLQKLQ